MLSSGSRPSPAPPSLPSTQQGPFVIVTTIRSITAALVTASIALVAIDNWSERHSVDTRSGRMRTQWCVFGVAFSSWISTPFASFEGGLIADSPRWIETGTSYWNGVSCSRAGKIPILLSQLDAELMMSTCKTDQRRQIARALLAWIDGPGNWYGCTIDSDGDVLRASASDGTVRWQTELCR